jgi:hypothetical protein
MPHVGEPQWGTISYLTAPSPDHLSSGKRPDIVGHSLSTRHCYFYCVGFSRFLSLQRQHMGGIICRYLGDDQQYLPVSSTSRTSLLQGQPRYRTTHAKNLCALGSSAAGCSTPTTLWALKRQYHPPYRKSSRSRNEEWHSGQAGAGGRDHGLGHLAFMPTQKRCDSGFYAQAEECVACNKGYRFSVTWLIPQRSFREVSLRSVCHAPSSGRRRPRARGPEGKGA